MNCPDGKEDCLVNHQDRIPKEKESTPKDSFHCIHSKDGRHCWHSRPYYGGPEKEVCCWCGVEEDRHGSYTLRPHDDRRRMYSSMGGLPKDE